MASGTIESRPWKRAWVWLAVLVPLFFASYDLANWLADRRHIVSTVVSAWDRAIPFVPWTIVPYLSLDVLYCLSLFCCTTRLELDRHVYRILAAEAVCIAIFIAFPLHFSFVRPPAHGVSGALFALLDRCDRPYNQAPSLHIANTVIVWACFRRHSEGVWRWGVDAWMLLIAISVLTTYQHHLVDVAAGLAVGLATRSAIPIRRVQTTS
jgi:hypothetical protein